MKKSRLSTCLVLTAFGHLLFASAAHAQTAAAPPPPPAPDAAPAGAPPPPYDPSAAVAVPQLHEPMMVGPVVRVTANSPVARLQMMRLRWVDVCTTPCGVAVDPNGTYRIGGGTIRPSIEFRMPRPAGPVLIRTEVGSTVKHWVGVGMIIGGLVGAASGVVYLAAGSSTKQDAFGNATTSDTYKFFGVTYLITGAIVTAIGIPLALSSTSVEVQ